MNDLDTLKFMIVSIIIHPQPELRLGLPLGQSQTDVSEVFEAGGELGSCFLNIE